MSDLNLMMLEDEEMMTLIEVLGALRVSDLTDGNAVHVKRIHNQAKLTWKVKCEQMELEDAEKS